MKNTLEYKGYVGSLEFSEEDVAYYIVDEQGNELGFALTEADGSETEYYYEGVDSSLYSPIDVSAARTGGAASPAGEAGNSKSGASASKPAHEQSFAERAGEEVGKFATKAGTQASKAAATAKDTVQKLRDKPKDEDLGFGLTAEGVKKAASEFTTLAKEGAETAAELKDVYNDIFGQLDFLKPSANNRLRRR